MVLKKHEDKPWEWVDNECFSNVPGHFVPPPKVKCDGVMELKDVNIKGGSLKVFTEEGKDVHDYVGPYLEKTWVCNGCGFIFLE